MNLTRFSFFTLILFFTGSFSYTQSIFSVNVNASNVTEVMPPIWRDHYENHLMHGYGGNPSVLGPHTSMVSDPNFTTEMNKLKTRYIRVSIGRADNPPDTNYYSTNTTVLKNLPYEFYKGANTLAAANNLNNYDFSYIDSMISLVQSIGAEPFITLDYMPFTLSSNSVPSYQGGMALLYNLAYDNKIRNAPPADNAVYGRVMYQLIKHCYTTFGVNYFEHWNEPDQQWLNPVMVKFFWTGDEYQLYNSYKAIADEVSADPSLSSIIKLGGCSFAFYSIGNLIPTRFLQEVKNNATKFDFLSFHPYSDTQFKGGYDTAKVILAKSWRDTYVPTAELINAEWGRIDPNTDTWGDLDYGLNKIEHIVDMLDRGVSMSFEVAFFDQETSTDNFAFLGMYRVGPIVAKSPAYVFYNMNSMNDALNRLAVSSSTGIVGLAGRNNTSDKVVIIVPASNPSTGNNIIHLQVSDLPWGTASFTAKRYELTEQSFAEGTIQNLTKSMSSSGGVFKDTLNYSSVNNSGRLVVWELISNTASVSELESEVNGIRIYPNPASNEINLEFTEIPASTFQISITNTLGSIVFMENVNQFKTNYTIQNELKSGVYFISVLMDGKTNTKKLVVE